eukprot:TRINITY_DN2486_c0_g1_i1.p1 TRINITY_DN2486_c0_g1~~TRINITY_DN2486_c0_g1_i1.p1  ORF type:complete len:152 (-),score=16.83 TRINITY_DN2486_c0_g1_i1:386-841(-)
MHNTIRIKSNERIFFPYSLYGYSMDKIQHAILYSFLILCIVLLATGPYLSLSLWFYLCFVTYTTGVRMKAREVLKIHEGNPAEDFFCESLHVSQRGTSAQASVPSAHPQEQKGILRDERSQRGRGPPKSCLYAHKCLRSNPKTFFIYASFV